MDKISAERRSENMRAIRNKDTTPELVVRRLVHAMGYRYRLHRPDLPGKPDLAFGPRQKVIFVHGCYWHGHGCKVGGAGAKSNREYWGPKISGNKARDRKRLRELTRMGWKVLTIWECETRKPLGLKNKLQRFLS